MRFALRMLSGLLLLSLGALAGAIGAGIKGYRALTLEEVAARVEVRPSSPQHFAATFQVPGRTEMTYEIAGDEIYVDAHILKWTPLANVLGLHTACPGATTTSRRSDPRSGRCIRWLRRSQWTSSGFAGATRFCHRCSTPSTALAPSSR